MPGLSFLLYFFAALLGMGAGLIAAAILWCFIGFGWWTFTLPVIFALLFAGANT